MKLLAVESATPASSVALGEGDRLRAMAVDVDRRSHVGFIGSAFDFCFARAGWEPGDVTAVVVDVGPGLFTGLRAGVAAAQGVAAAVGVPIVTVSSLDVLAFRAATGHRRIWAVVDARKGQVAVRAYRPLPGGVAADGSAELVRPVELRAQIESDSENVLVVGDVAALGDTLQGSRLVRLGRPRFPRADMVLEIGAMKAARDEFAAPTHVRPLYMRAPDAAINWKGIREEALWPQ